MESPAELVQRYKGCKLAVFKGLKLTQFKSKKAEKRYKQCKHLMKGWIALHKLLTSIY